MWQLKTDERCLFFCFFIFENPKIVKRCNFRPDFFRRGRLHKSIVSVEAAVYIGKLRVTYPAGAFNLWWRLGCLDPLVVMWFKESWIPLHRPLGFGPPPQIKFFIMGWLIMEHLIWGGRPNPMGPCTTGSTSWASVASQTLWAHDNPSSYLLNCSQNVVSITCTLVSSLVPLFHSFIMLVYQSVRGRPPQEFFYVSHSGRKCDSHGPWGSRIVMSGQDLLHY